MKDPSFVAFATQKGGAGKTTLTVLTASYLYYVKKMKVLVVDCDYPQYSVKELRDRDLQITRINKSFATTVKEQLNNLDVDPYPILMCRPEEAMGKVKALYDKCEHYDIVLFDMSGTINNPGVAKTVSLMDYIFIPVTADKIVLESSLAFAIKVRDEILTLPDSSIREMHMLWNKVDAREKTDLYDKYEIVFEEQLLTTLKTRLPDRKRYSREVGEDGDRAVFRCTLLPPDKKLLRGSGFPELLDELLGIIKL